MGRAMTAPHFVLYYVTIIDDENSMLNHGVKGDVFLEVASS